MSILAVKSCIFTKFILIDFIFWPVFFLAIICNVYLIVTEEDFFATCGLLVLHNNI